MHTADKFLHHCTKWPSFGMIMLMCAFVIYVSEATDKCAIFCNRGQYCSGSECLNCHKGTFQSHNWHQKTECIKHTPKPPGSHWTLHCVGNTTTDNKWKCEEGYVEHQYSSFIGDIECRPISSKPRLPEKEITARYNPTVTPQLHTNASFTPFHHTTASYNESNRKENNSDSEATISSFEVIVIVAGFLFISLCVIVGICKNRRIYNPVSTLEDPTTDLYSESSNYTNGRSQGIDSPQEEINGEDGVNETQSIVPGESQGIDSPQEEINGEDGVNETQSIVPGGSPGIDSSQEEINGEDGVNETQSIVPGDSQGIDSTQEEISGEDGVNETQSIVPGESQGIDLPQEEINGEDGVKETQSIVPGESQGIDSPQEEINGEDGVNETQSIVPGESQGIDSPQEEINGEDGVIEAQERIPNKVEDESNMAFPPGKVSCTNVRNGSNEQAINSSRELNRGVHGVTPAPELVPLLVQNLTTESSTLANNQSITDPNLNNKDRESRNVISEEKELGGVNNTDKMLPQHNQMDAQLQDHSDPPQSNPPHKSVSDKTLSKVKQISFAQFLISELPQNVLKSLFYRLKKVGLNKPWIHLQYTDKPQDQTAFVKTLVDYMKNCCIQNKPFISDLRRILKEDGQNEMLQNENFCQMSKEIEMLFDARNKSAECIFRNLGEKMLDKLIYQMQQKYGSQSHDDNSFIEIQNEKQMFILWMDQLDDKPFIDQLGIQLESLNKNEKLMKNACHLIEKIKSFY